MINGHMTTQKATCSSSTASEMHSSKDSLVDLRSKKKKQRKNNPDKSFTPFSANFLYIKTKKK